MSIEKSIESEVTATLLILERGAEWPSWAMDLRARGVNSAVEIQSADETTAQFHKRIGARIEEMSGMGQCISAVGYVCALASLGRKSMRRALCCRLLAALHEGENSELILAGGSWEPVGQAGDARSRLIELWGELSGRLAGRSVSVRFEDPPSESGVFFAADKLNQPLSRYPNDGLEAAVALS